MFIAYLFAFDKCFREASAYFCIELRVKIKLRQSDDTKILELNNE